MHTFNHKTSVFPHPFPHPKIKSERLPSTQYEKLFEAAWKGDLAEIEALTIKAPKGVKPLAVCVLNFQGHTPLTIAVMRNHPQCVKRLIDIAELQYVPYDETLKEDKEEIKINNLDLAKGKFSFFFLSFFWLSFCLPPHGFY